MYQGKYYAIDNFSGGYCGNLPITQLATNQASDLDNIVILPAGKGIRSRNGSSKLNSTALNSGTFVQGIGHYIQADQDEWLVAVAGNKFYHSSNISGTFTDATGALTITAGRDRKWDLFTFNDELIGFGGPPENPDAPFKWTGTGDATALSGSPPSAYGGLTANNRCFAFRTAPNPSTIYWSIIANAEDWTGSGSGSATIGSIDDNQRITGAVVISTNYMLIFKENSTYQMVISQAPFSTYTLFENVGAVGKNAIVNVDGIVYFITKDKEMVATDGRELKRFPPNADDLFNGILTDRLPFIEGVRHRSRDHDWIIWSCAISGSDSNRRAIIWDLENQCWLHCSSGWRACSFGTNLSDGTTYLGDESGFIYLQDQASDYSDDTSSISSFWQSGWMNPDTIDKIVQVNRLVSVHKAQTSGSLTYSYGYDFVLNGTSFTASQAQTGSETHITTRNMLSGRGNAFEFKVALSSSTVPFELHKVLLGGKVQAQKVFTAD